MAQYFLPFQIDKYIVLDQDPFPIQIITDSAFLYQFSYGPGHNIKYAYGLTSPHQLIYN